MNALGWICILGGSFLIMAVWKGKVFDSAGNFVLPDLVKQASTALLTGDTAKLSTLLAGSTDSTTAPVVAGGATAAGTGTGGGASSFGGRAAVVAGAQRYRGDKYSQAKRREPGWSDCSSFVDKALKSAGINPPGNAWAITTGYMHSPDWPVIPASQAQAGDIAVNANHMVLITDANLNAIGQENSQVNVRVGTVANLMTNTGGGYTIRTYKGYATPVAGGGGGTGSW